jgi:hypothetical protein
MEIVWYSYCLVGLLVLGLGDYIKKLVTSKWYDKDVFLSTCFILYILFFLINFLIVWDNNITQREILISLPAGVFDFMIPMWMLAALKYADSSLSFVTIRLITSFTLLAIWAWYFWDNLNAYNLFGFALWIIAIFLLSWFQFWKKYEIHKKWFWWIIIAIVWITLGNSYFKYFVDNVDIPSFMFLKFTVTWILVFLYLTVRKRWWNYNINTVKKIIPYAIITTLLFLFQFGYVFPKIYSLGPLSISYKILSYSLAVPIILSVIFHNEKLTKKRIIAFTLTTASLLFFFF